MGFSYKDELCMDTFYIGCPPECLTAEHCVSLYKDDPNFEDLPGVDSPANWECNDGECVFSG